MILACSARILVWMVGSELMARQSGGQSFTLNNVTYVSDAASPVTGTGKLTFYKTAPMLLLGFGNLVPRGKWRFSMSFDFGAGNDSVGVDPVSVVDERART